MCGMQPELAGGISFDDAVDAIEEVAPIKNNAKETFVNATSGSGDNVVGGVVKASESGSMTKIIAGKNFKNHFIRHESLLENVTEKNSKYKTHGQEFLDDIGKIIDDGTVEFVGKGTLKKDNQQ